MIVYTRTCLPCTHKQQWHALRKFARERGIQIEQRRVTHNPEWMSQAEKYGINLPFIVNGKQALSLSKALELLEEL